MNILQFYIYTEFFHIAVHHMELEAWNYETLKFFRKIAHFVSIWVYGPEFFFFFCSILPPRGITETSNSITVHKIILSQNMDSKFIWSARLQPLLSQSRPTCRMFDTSSLDSHSFWCSLTYGVCLKCLQVTHFMFDSELFCFCCLVSDPSNAAGDPDSMAGECQGSGVGWCHAEE